MDTHCCARCETTYSNLLKSCPVCLEPNPVADAHYAAELDRQLNPRQTGASAGAGAGADAKPVNTVQCARCKRFLPDHYEFCVCGSPNTSNDATIAGLAGAERVAVVDPFREIPKGTLQNIGGVLVVKCGACGYCHAVPPEHRHCGVYRCGQGPGRDDCHASRGTMKKLRERGTAFNPDGFHMGRGCGAAFKVVGKVGHERVIPVDDCDRPTGGCWVSL